MIYTEKAKKAMNWVCDHLSECITEEQANRLINGEKWKNVRTGNEKVF